MMMFVDLYIDSRDIAKYNSGKSIRAYDREYGVTSTTKVVVPADEVKVVGMEIHIHKVSE